MDSGNPCLRIQLLHAPGELMLEQHLLLKPLLRRSDISNLKTAAISQTPHVRIACDIHLCDPNGIYLKLISVHFWWYGNQGSVCSQPPASWIVSLNDVNVLMPALITFSQLNAQSGKFQMGFYLCLWFMLSCLVLLPRTQRQQKQRTGLLLFLWMMQRINHLSRFQENHVHAFWWDRVYCWCMHAKTHSSRIYL